MSERLANGTKVRVTVNPKYDRQYTAASQIMRMIWNEQVGTVGTVVEHHDSHGLCYGVEFPIDGGPKAIAFFEPEELEVMR